MDEDDAEEDDDHVDDVRAEAAAEEDAPDGLRERVHERGREPLVAPGRGERGLQVLARDVAARLRRRARLAARVEVLISSYVMPARSARLTAEGA